MKREVSLCPCFRARNADLAVDARERERELRLFSQRARGRRMRVGGRCAIVPATRKRTRVAGRCAYPGRAYPQRAAGKQGRAKRMKGARSRGCVDMVERPWAPFVASLSPPPSFSLDLASGERANPTESSSAGSQSPLDDSLLLLSCWLNLRAKETEKGRALSLSVPTIKWA